MAVHAPLAALHDYGPLLGEKKHTRGKHLVVEKQPEVDQPRMCRRGHWEEGAGELRGRVGLEDREEARGSVVERSNAAARDLLLVNMLVAAQDEVPGNYPDNFLVYKADTDTPWL